MTDNKNVGNVNQPNNGVVPNQTQVNNQPPLNNTPKKPKKGFWKHLGFSERLLFIVFSVFTVGVVAGVPLYTYVFNKTFTVTFDPSYEGAKTTTETVKKDETVNKPTDPKQDGYAFLGWRKDKEKKEYYNFSDKVTSDFTLYGTWGKEFTVTFDLNYEGSQSFSKTVIDGNVIGSITTPTRNKYVFLDWCTDKDGKNKFDLNTPITADINLYAHWRDIYKYNITFNLNYDGSTPISQVVDEGKKIERIKDPSRTYYTFDNWYVEKDCKTLFDFDKSMSGEVKDIEIFANWNAIEYTATFYSNAGGKEYEEIGHDTIQMPKKQKFTPIKEEEYEHYDFIGWYTKNEKGDFEEFDFDKEASGDVKLYSRYSKTICNVTIDYNYDSKTEIKQVNHGDFLKIDDPERVGFKFLGWFDAATGGNEFNIKTTPIEKKEITIYAQWLELSLQSITVSNIKSSTYLVDESITASDFVVTALFNDGIEQTIPYYKDSETSNGYKIMLNDEELELPHVCLGAEIGNDIPLVFEYTFKSTTKTFTLKIDIVAAVFKIIPVSSSSNPDYRSLNFNYRNDYNINGISNYFDLEGFTDYGEINNLELICRSDLTGEAVDIIRGVFKPTWLDHYVLKLEFNTENTFHGSATITMRHKNDQGQVDKAGSIKIEVGSFSYFTFSANEDDNTTCSMRIDEKLSYGEYNLITPTKYYFNDENGECGSWKVTKFKAVSEDKKELYEKFYKSVNLTDNITSIEKHNFDSQEYLSDVIISKNIISIPDYAFFFCNSLTNLEIKNGVKYIGDYAFMKAYHLNQINLPDSVLELGNSCFCMCGSEATYKCSLTLSNNLKKIDSMAFYECSWTKSGGTITLPQTLIYIGNGGLANTGQCPYKFQFAEGYRTYWKLYENNPILSEEKPFKELSESELSDVDNTTIMLTKYSDYYEIGYAKYYWYRKI